MIELLIHLNNILNRHFCLILLDSLYISKIVFNRIVPGNKKTSVAPKPLLTVGSLAFCEVVIIKDYHLF